jgi:hypothetical protein
MVADLWFQLFFQSGTFVRGEGPFKITSDRVRPDKSRVTTQALLIASSGLAIWKLTRLEGFGNRFKVQDYVNRDTW